MGLDSALTTSGMAQATVKMVSFNRAATFARRHRLFGVFPANLSRLAP
jgi:hypothetical protein